MLAVIDSDPLEERMGPVAAARRRAIESGDRRRRFGHPQHWTAIENWPGSRQLIRLALGLIGLHGRAHRNARAIALRENALCVHGLPRQFEGFTLLHLSDLHLDIAPDVPDVIAAAVRGHRYDACVMTGDYRSKTYGPSDATIDGMRRICAELHDPMYAVLGNHDGIALVPAFEAMGIRMLMNEAVTLQRGDARIALVGIDDHHFFRLGSIPKAISGVPAEVPTILLSHAPEIYRQAAQAGLDVMLCGHTHGGQICLPGGHPITVDSAIPRRMGRGAWRRRNMVGYTSPGAGTSIVDVRINCPPEITLHRLRAVPGA